MHLGHLVIRPIMDTLLVLSEGSADWVIAACVCLTRIHQH